LNDYNYRDATSTLVLGTSYSYKVRTKDVGGNSSSDVSTTCIPEDLKSPGMVDSLIVTLKTGVNDVDLNGLLQTHPKASRDIRI